MNEWEARPLRAYADVRLGRQRSPQNAEGPNMVRYLRAANVNDGTLDLSDVKRMNFTPEEQRVFSLLPGDVLVTEGSGSLSSVGASAIWLGELSGVVCFQNTLIRLRPRSDRTDGRFLGWWARHAFADGLFAAIATGANIHHVSAERVRDLRMSFPPLNIQRSIADFLDTETARVGALIAKKRRLVDLIGQRRRSLMLAGVAGLLTSDAPRNNSSLSWLDSLPEHWQEVGLTLIARLGSGHTPSRKRDEWWIESECTIPWITTGEVARLRSDRVEDIDETRERISPIGLENSAAEVHPAGTVVLCRTASAGYSGIMSSEMATSQDFVTWTCGPLLRPRFLLLCLRAMRNDLLGRLAMGSTHKTIYMPDIQELGIPLPPLDEQDEIVEAVWRLIGRDGHIEDSLSRQIELLAERRQALITAAVTGELDVAEGIAAEAS